MTAHEFHALSQSARLPRLLHVPPAEVFTADQLADIVRAEMVGGK